MNIFVSERRSNDFIPRTTQADERCSTMSPRVVRSSTPNATPSPSRSLNNNVDRQSSLLQSSSPTTNKRKGILSVSQGGNNFDDTEDISDINGELKQLKRMMAKIYSLQKRATVKEVTSINRTRDFVVDRQNQRGRESISPSSIYSFRFCSCQVTVEESD